MFPFLFYWTKVQQHQVSCSFYNCYQIHELIFIHIIFTDYSLCLWEFFLYGYCFSFFFFLSVIFLVKQYTCLVAQLYLTLCNPTDYSPPGSPSMGFSRQEYWSRLPCTPPGDLSKPEIKPGFDLTDQRGEGGGKVVSFVFPISPEFGSRVLHH